MSATTPRQTLTGHGVRMASVAPSIGVDESRLVARFNGQGDSEKQTEPWANPDVEALCVYVCLHQGPGRVVRALLGRMVVPE